MADLLGGSGSGSLSGLSDVDTELGLNAEDMAEVEQLVLAALGELPAQPLPQLPPAAAGEAPPQPPAERQELPAEVVEGQPTGAAAAAVSELPEAAAAEEAPAAAGLLAASEEEQPPPAAAEAEAGKLPAEAGKLPTESGKPAEVVASAGPGAAEAELDPGAESLELPSEASEEGPGLPEAAAGDAADRSGEGAATSNASPLAGPGPEEVNAEHRDIMGQHKSVASAATEHTAHSAAAPLEHTSTAGGDEVEQEEGPEASLSFCQSGASDGADSASSSPSSQEAPLTLFQAAEAAEARLASGSASGPSGRSTSSTPGSEDLQYRRELLVASLASQLDGAAAAWPEEGVQGDRGAALGGQLAARAFLSPQLEPVFRAGAASGAAAAAAGGRGGAGRGVPSMHSMPSALTKYMAVVAVGTSAGSAHVLMPGKGNG